MVLGWKAMVIVSLTRTVFGGEVELRLLCHGLVDLFSPHLIVSSTHTRIQAHTAPWAAKLERLLSWKEVLFTSFGPANMALHSGFHYLHSSGNR